MYNPEDLAYIAGIVDGEGCIIVATHSSGSNTIRVVVAMADPEPLQLCYNVFGGWAYKRKNTNGRTLYSWYVQSKTALNVLRAIEPYIRGKREQVELALQFPTSDRGHKTSQEEKLIRATIKFRLSEMKRVEKDVAIGNLEMVS